MINNKDSEFLLAAAIMANPKLSMEQAVHNARNVLTGVIATPQQIKDSVRADKIKCLEDGTRHVMLRRYIRRRFNMTPEQYRVKRGLPDDYPFVAPEYTARRSKIAKKSGLGKK